MDAKSFFPHLAEIGRAAYVAAAALLVLVAVSEFFLPGIAATAISPQLVVAIGAIGGALALLAPAPPRSAVRRAAYVIVGVAASAIALAVGWRSVGPAHRWLVAAITFIVASIFVAFYA